MKKNIINKAKKIICNVCGREFSSMSLSSHIKHSHKEITIESYVKKFGEFRKNKLNTSKGNRKIQLVLCEICNKSFSIVGMATHLRDTHNMTVESYVSKYSEYRPKYKDYKARAEQNKIKCLYPGCNQIFGSEKLLSYHIHTHNISKEEYIRQFFFNNKKQYCKCGCGKEVNIRKQHPYRVDYVSGHNPNGMSGKHHKKESLQKMSESAILRIGDSTKNNTEIEIKFRDWLINRNIEFMQQFPYESCCIDFYLPEYDLFVELDGEYWHPMVKENLNFQLICGAISEHKRRNIPNLIRIRENDICEIMNCKSVSELSKFNSTPDFRISYKQKIISKEFFIDYINRNGKEKLNNYIELLLKFIRTFQPSIPTPDTKETTDFIAQTISKFDLTKLKNDNIFLNTGSCLGVSYLKQHFQSFWNSSFKGNKNPTEAWLDDNIMRQVIKYRIGINNSNEVFDFSLHQLIRGLSARRLTISFFKPLLAACIYDTYLKNKLNPTVFDPCAGFGGRLLGFKSKFPLGTYIGIEPNPDTFQELTTLVEKFKFKNVKLFNCKIEDFNEKIEYDMCFTSIPYFDIEQYSRTTEYLDFNNWNDTFIKKILSYKNSYINLPIALMEQLNLSDKIVAYIKSNKSHFSTKTPIEAIIKI